MLFRSEESAKLGFQGRHLIAMQGPFSREMNLALLRYTDAAYFVTKESGETLERTKEILLEQVKME